MSSTLDALMVVVVVVEGALEGLHRINDTLSLLVDVASEQHGAS